MSPSVEVAIPTYANNGTTIKLVLEKLTKQTYDDFNTLVVYKPSPNDFNTIMLESYSKNLSIKIVEQKEGKIEE
ncbi:MAG: glycosyltransferase, partial [Metallosphaera sp.]